MAIYFDADEPNIDADGNVDMEVRSDTPQHLYAVGIDSADAERVFRLAFSRASLTSADDMQLTRGAAVPLGVTLSALDDAGTLAYVKLGPRATGNGGGNGRRARKAKGAAAEAA